MFNQLLSFLNTEPLISSIMMNSKLIRIPKFVPVLIVIFGFLSVNQKLYAEADIIWIPAINEEYSDTETDTIRVLNYNIRFGMGMDHEVDIHRIARVILDANADIVALQEVDAGVERSFRFDIMKILEGYTGLEAIFYKNIHHQGGEYGNGILSRYPVQSSRNYHYVVEGSSEQRGLLQTELLIKGQKIAFMNTHLDHGPNEMLRLMSADQIIETKKAYRGMPVLLAGDINDIPGSETHLKLSQYFEDVWDVIGEGDGFTFRSDDPDRRIDYIFYSNDLAGENTRILRPVSVDVLDTQASDHRPVLAVFVLE